MPQFTTISPTCKLGGKPDAWELFRAGGYVAIGWCYATDLTGWTTEEILAEIEDGDYSHYDRQDGLYSFPRFMKLRKGDYVAVNNANHGLFGVGRIKTGKYLYQRNKHATGEPNHFYNHYLEVKSLWEQYISADLLKFKGEKRWRPRGTVGEIYPQLPQYIKPFIGV
jgi:hypothetical protein